MLAAGEARLLFRGPRTLSNRKERGWRGRAFSRRCHFRSAAPLDGSHGDRGQEFVVGLVRFEVSMDQPSGGVQQVAGCVAWS